MRARLIVIALGFAALAGCGSSHSSSTAAATGSTAASTSSPPASSAPTIAPAQLAALSAGLLRQGDLPGFAPEVTPVAAQSARRWLQLEGVPAAERASATAALERAGFVAALRERLLASSGHGSEGLSLVEQFDTSAGAAAHLAAEVRNARARGAEVLPLAQIPGSIGFGFAAGETVGVNLVFTHGAYYYLLGASYPKGSAGAPSIVDLLAAARRVYARVRS